MVARCCKPGPLDQERHCHATTPGTISAQRGAELKRQDQLGQAGKRKHFDGSEWKKKCRNFTMCGKPNEQLSRYNQAVTVGKWFGNVFSKLERESYSKGPFGLHTAN